MEISKEVLTQISKFGRVKQNRALTLLGQQEWEKCAADPIYWLDAGKHDGIPYVYTLDNHPMHRCKLCGDSATHATNKRKLHLQITHEIEDPSDADIEGNFTEIPTTRPFEVKPYMPPIIYWWLREPLLAVEKSRDMIATWLIVALYTWNSIFHPGRQNIFQSEDALKTIELVRRAWFMYSHQPKWLKPYKAYFGAGISRSGIMTVKGLNSEILGFPQGPNQIRQYHPSGIFLDEAAYQAEAGAAFAAIKPAIQNGGRCTMISSANPGFFMQICRDTVQDV